MRFLKIKGGGYEFIVSDIFDHVIAAVDYFDLSIYELNSIN